MKISMKRSSVADCGFIKQVIVFLSFICCLLILISCSEGDNRLEEESFSFSEEDVQHEKELGFYLYNDYASSIHSVSVTESSVKITGKYVGEGDFILGEIAPYILLSAKTF